MSKIQKFEFNTNGDPNPNCPSCKGTGKSGEGFPELNLPPLPCQCTIRDFRVIDISIEEAPLTITIVD